MIQSINPYKFNNKSKAKEMSKNDFGLIGLAVMGQNLVLNVASRGFNVSVYNRTSETTQEFLNGTAKGKNIEGFENVKDFVSSLEMPRKIMLMVKSTAGNDINDFISMPKGLDCRETHVIKFIQAVSDFQKPIIANVNGLAIGIGVTILMHCDFVYSTKETRFMLPFVNLGLCPEAASSILIPLNSNMLIAKEKLLLGEAFDSADALKMGIVSKIFNTEQEMVETTSETTAKLCDLPSSSISSTKKLINLTFKEIIKARIIVEGEKLFELLHTEEAKKAFSKFLRN